MTIKERSDFIKATGKGVELKCTAFVIRSANEELFDHYSYNTLNWVFRTSQTTNSETADKIISAIILQRKLMGRSYVGCGFFCLPLASYFTRLGIRFSYADCYNGKAHLSRTLGCAIPIDQLLLDD